MPRSSPRILLLLSGWIIALSLVPDTAIGAGKGRWSPNQDWRGVGGSPKRYAVHMALLPGESPLHSRILWYHGEEGTEFLGGQWGWTPGNEGCSAYPTTSFSNLSTSPPLSTMDPFCGGASLIDRNLMTVGGTDPSFGDYGTNQVRLFTPGTGSTYGAWTAPTAMQSWRWYPTTVPLRQGILALAGRHHRGHRMFGGYRNGSAPTSPDGDLVRRQQPISYGTWDESVLPAIETPVDSRPVARYGHTMVQLKSVPGFFADLLFGGRDADGNPQNDVWRLQEYAYHPGATPQYQWFKVNPTEPPGGPPPRRSDHVMVRTPDVQKSLILFGGRGVGTGLLNDVWRLFRNSQSEKLEWGRITPSGQAPAARHGQTAIYDATVDSALIMRERIIVFGGVTSYGSNPTDSDVYELRFDATDPTVATWHKMVVVDIGPGVPAPRYWHTMVADTAKNKLGVIDSAHVGLMFGGKRSSSAYSDTLWGLWIMKNGRVGWQVRATSASGTNTPSARARHSMVYDEYQNRRLYIYGGENASGPVDSYVYAINTWDNVVNPPWSQWADRGYTLSGHTATLELEHLNARIPEVFDPATGNWTAHSSAPMNQTNYPVAFSVPGAGNEKSRVINVHWDTLLTYYADFPKTGQASAWRKLPNGAIGFRAKPGVQYRPGRLMVAGGELVTANITGLTATIDASDTNNAWVFSDSMAKRSHHNLVLLPTGQVLAVGGNDQFDHPSASPVRRPQIWTPGASSGGTWTSYNGADSLAIQPTVRGYHSTAILLPDGRVLSAGGDSDGDGDQPAYSDKFVANLYCPPYLYKSDGATPVTTRPTLSRMPRIIRWGQTFNLCTPDRAAVTRVCLVAPGSTTHSIDMNQRYVPLVFGSGLPGAQDLSVTAPASPDSAPSGYYMLFLTGSQDGPDVPSVATWIRLGWSDAADATAPAVTEDLAIDLVSSSSMSLTWTAPADDGSSAASGVANEYDLRHATSAISSETQWGAASHAACEPDPAVVGTGQGMTLNGLTSCTWHYFQLRTWDDKPQLSSLFSGEIKARTTCGGGGGGAALVEARDRQAPLAGPKGPRPASTSSRETSTESSRVLVAESSADANSNRWSLVLRWEPVNEIAAGVATIQVRGEGDAWRTVSTLAPTLADQELLVPVLRKNRRVVFPPGYELGACAGLTTSAGSEPLGIVSATSSTRGSLDISAIGNLAMAPDESLMLRFEPVEGVSATSEDAALSVVRRGAVPSRLRQRPPEARGVTAFRFALHGAHPNPATGRVSLRFQVPTQTEARLEIFDLLGRRVGTLISGQIAAGMHSVGWAGPANRDGSKAPGLYIARLTIPGAKAEKKFAMLP